MNPLDQEPTHIEEMDNLEDGYYTKDQLDTLIEQLNTIELLVRRLTDTTEQIQWRLDILERKSRDKEPLNLAIK